MSPPKSIIWPLDPHTLAKHAILENYLKAWFPILASSQGRLVYYDGFAGPGRYSEGEDGSPIIALKVALTHRAKLKSELVFVFVEQRSDRADHLEHTEIPALQLPPNFKTDVVRMDFEGALSSTLDALDSKGLTIAPTFAFVDPFGIKGLPFSLIGRLLKRRSCEVLITFMNETIQRFGTELPEHVNALIGNPEAAALIAQANNRPVEARRLYEASLHRVARFVRFFQLRDSNNQPIYDLFFASNNDLGHYRMKEAMWKVDATGYYSFSDGVDPAQQTIFSPDPGPEVATVLWQRFKGRTVDAVDVLRYTRDQTPYLEKHARAGLTILERSAASSSQHIEVAETKIDGLKRRANSFASGTLIAFVAGAGDHS